MDDNLIPEWAKPEWAKEPAKSDNPFDIFDATQASGNPFDRFDKPIDFSGLPDQPTPKGQTSSNIGLLDRITSWLGGLSQPANDPRAAENRRRASQGVPQLPPEGSPEYETEMRHSFGQDVQLPQALTERPDALPANTKEAYNEGGILGAAFYPKKISSLIAPRGELPEAKSKPEQIAKALATFPVDAADFLTSPEGVATAASTSVGGPLIRTAIALGFTVQQAKAALEAGTLEDQIKAVLGAGLSAAGFKTELKSGKVRPKVEARSKSVPEALQATVEAPGDIQSEFDAASDLIARKEPSANVIPTTPEITQSAQPTELPQGKLKLRPAGESGAATLAPLEPVAENIQAHLEHSRTVDEIASGYDSVDTVANVLGSQWSNRVRLDFGGVDEAAKPASQTARDLDAVSFVIESGRDPAQLAHDLELVATSKNKTLARKYTPILEYAMQHFDRLAGTPTSYDALMEGQRNSELQAGLKVGDVENYVTHVLSRPEEQSGFVPATGGGRMTRYFTKGRVFDSLAGAIHHGYDPKSVNLADLTQKRINAGQRLVLQKHLFDRLGEIKASDGQKVIGAFTPDKSMPRGYELVTANRVPIVVHHEYADLFRALYGKSAVRETKVGRAALKVAAMQKAYALAVDMFHAARMSYKGLAYGGEGARVGFNRGLSVLEFAEKDLSRAVKAGDISQKQAAYARKFRPVVNELLAQGLNVGRWSDNIVREARAHFPGTGKLNDWIFSKLSRGAMLQAAVANYVRNLSRFPELGRRGAAKRTAVEMNEVFGNLANQGIFKSKTFQDTARLIFLAPQWVESQMKAELRGYGQLAKAPIDLLRGKPRLGAVAQGQLTGVAAMLVGGQLLNYLTTGHSTFQNPGDHKLDAFIPIGKGLWFSPFSLFAEYGHRAGRYWEKHENAIDVATQIAYNKLSANVRAATELATGRDSFGKRYKDTTERIRNALLDTIPTPFAASALIRRDVRSPIGYDFTPNGEKMFRQIVRTIGLEVTPDRPNTKPVRNGHRY